MLGVYLGMTRENLEGAGLPFKRSAGISDRVLHYDLGDPRSRNGTIRTVLFEGRVVYIDGYQLERNGVVLTRVEASVRNDVEKALGAPPREADRIMRYPDCLLQVSLFQGIVSFLSLGVQPDVEAEIWPRVNDPDFSSEEIERCRGLWPLP